jgi:hypothetical protein
MANVLGPERGRFINAVDEVDLVNSFEEEAKEQFVTDGNGQILLILVLVVHKTSMSTSTLAVGNDLPG